MKKTNWKLALVVGAAALAVAAAAVALIVTNHDRAPGDGLPDAVAPSVSVPVYTTEPEPEATPTPTQPGPPERVTFVGDSIMVAAESQLYNYIPDCVVDAKEGRQLVEAMDILRRLESEGQLYETVVIGLGSNSPFPIEDGEEVLDFLGEDRTVYWVTCYGRYLDWQDEVNELIYELDAEYDNLYVLDWSSVAPENPSWIRSDDGIHLTPDGTVGYARFVAASLGYELPDEEESAE